MNDDRANSAMDQTDEATAAEAAVDEPTDGGILDEFDDPVLAADDTGMLRGERLITEAEIEEGLEGDV